MRYLFPLACLLVVVGGIVFGALNSQPLNIDLWYFALPVPSGLALLLAALLGAIAAGVCLAVTVIWPQQLRLRRLLKGVALRGSTAERPT
jgi:uncharacterized integral membrane protein